MNEATGTGAAELQPQSGTVCSVMPPILAASAAQHRNRSHRKLTDAGLDPSDADHPDGGGVQVMGDIRRVIAGVFAECRG